MKPLSSCTLGLVCLMTGVILSCRGPYSPARPSLTPFRCHEYTDLVDGAVTARFMGTSSVLFRDSSTAVLSEGFVSRPGPLRVKFGKIAPDTARATHALRCLGVDTLDAVFTTHSHYDHAMDAPVMAEKTGARLIGSASTRWLGLGYGLPDKQITVVGPRDTITFGSFHLTFIESAHAPGDRYPGVIREPVRLPAPTAQYKGDTVMSVILKHAAGSILVHGTAGFRHEKLAGQRADVVYLAIGELSKQSRDFVDALWREVVVATCARRVFVMHWDDQFRGLDKPLRALPYLGGSLPVAMDWLLGMGERDHVEVMLPVLWQPTDPFKNLRPRRRSASPECSRRTAAPMDESRRETGVRSNSRQLLAMSHRWSSQ